MTAHVFPPPFQVKPLSVGSLRYSRARGFSLIEVLVAIVIFSFGILGMVGMQAFALQSNRDSIAQAQAVILARELAEMMRGNKVDGVKTGTDNPYLGSFNSPLASANANYCMNVSNASTGCTVGTAPVTSPATPGTTGNVGSAQLTEWLARVDEALPGARVVICLDGAPYNASGIAQWGCTAAGTDEIIVIKIGWTRGSLDRSKENTVRLNKVTDSNSTPYVVFPVTSGSQK